MKAEKKFKIETYTWTCNAKIKMCHNNRMSIGESNCLSECELQMEAVPKVMMKNNFEQIDFVIEC